MNEAQYTVENTDAAYQLDWSYSLFWRESPTTWEWVGELPKVMEQDSIRVLNHKFAPPRVSQFLISTTPDVSPMLIAQRLKGRLQHWLKGVVSQPFQRNYALRSLGSTKRDKVEAYLASQLRHHKLADERFEQKLAKYQIVDNSVDLSAPRETAHARYWYNLHLVFVTPDREWHADEEFFAKLQAMVIGAARKKGHWLSRASLLPDHVHLALGCELSESPETVALSYMNNLAHSVQAAAFEHRYWVGTFGEYDLGAVKADVY